MATKVEGYRIYVSSLPDGNLLADHLLRELGVLASVHARSTPGGQYPGPMGCYVEVPLQGVTERKITDSVQRWVEGAALPSVAEDRPKSAVG